MSSPTDHVHDPPSPHGPHIALFPSAGMGHLTPNLRLAAMLSAHNCLVTLIVAQPRISTAESAHIAAFLAVYPAINHLDFHIVPYNATDSTTNDPFFIQFEAIIRSAYILAPLLSSASPPITAIFADVASAEGVCPVADDLGIPNYILATVSARFCSFLTCLPYLISPGTGNTVTMADDETSVRVPGVPPFDKAVIPQVFHIPNHMFTKMVISSAICLTKAKGILVNTFHAFEPETIAALNAGKVQPDFPPFFPIGPLQPHKLEVGDKQPLVWLNQQPAQSVVYVSFGSRTAMSRDQIIELRNGLEGSGQRFLWVLKSTIVDKEDNETIEEVLGDLFIRRTKNIGMVVKGWVCQEDILSHSAIGCFISHCGWNSVTEAAARGVPVLAWPQHGDQRINAEVVAMSGLGVWDKNWGWLGEEPVKGEVVAGKVKMVMSDENIKKKARKIGEKAKNAMKPEGTSYKTLTEVIQNLQHKQDTNRY